MLVKDIIDSKKISVSFEFFPPQSKESSEKLFNNITKLTPLKPSFVSVTYGAAGTTRNLTHDLVLKIKKETDLEIISHLTCVGSTKDEIKKILTQYDQANIHNILALRGDPPKDGSPISTTKDGFEYAADLVTFIKKHFPHMGVGVAGFPEGHPGCPNRLKEIEYLKAKVDAGADYICTQLFFDNRDFYDFCERCKIAGIKVPIIAGIMPITSRSNIKRMADLALGARFPAKLLKSLSRAENDDYVRKVGIHWATQQVMDLIDNDVKGIHFYTLNQSKATKEIYETLGISSSSSLEDEQTFI